MTFSIFSFRTQVDYLINADNDIISETAREEIIRYAMLERYNHDAPDTETDDVTGDAGKYYAITTSLTSWSEGFSRVTAVEYPAATIASDEMPQYLDPEDWQDDYWASDTRYLWLPNHAPAATETMRITYTVPYAWTGTPLVTTVPAQDFSALCNLAAGLICQAIAAKFSRTTDSSILADSVDHPSRAREFREQARAFIAMYEKHMGIGEDASIKAAGEFVDWDTEPTWPAGRQFIFHHGGVR